jgi:outer membrane protein TolC
LALSQASAAESRKRLTQQNADCDLALKALVSLTALDETRLRQRLGTGAVAALELPGFGVAQVPAQTVSQRPDVFSAERDVVVASAAVGSAQAQRWPRLTLSGSIGALRYASTGTETDMTTWSFGPLALSVPVFDAGQRAANVVAAQAQYAQSVVAYRAKVRAAVREVEEALVALQSVQERHADTVLALRGYTQALEACAVRYQKGMASLLELEETRRMALGAELALDALQLERQRAWLALYRAAGGGWEPDSSAATPLAPGPSAAP